MFEFKISAKDKKSLARTGEFQTPHGVLQTPALATVGTEGQIRSVAPETAQKLPVSYAIVNTFHIWTKEIIPKIVGVRSSDPPLRVNPTIDTGGNTPPLRNTVHQYGGFPGVLASDSGGFQVFSLGFGKIHQVGKVANIFPGEKTGILSKDEGETSHTENLDINNPVKISEEGVVFNWENTERNLTPEISMQLQHQIGADIIFAFDECTSSLNSKEYTAKSLDLSHRWLERCIAEHKSQSVGARLAPPSLRENATNRAPQGTPLQQNPQALFAILQGGLWENLRVKAAKYCAKADVPGYGLGGALGKTKEDMYEILGWMMPHLPDEKPRHLLGIGHVRDLFEGVEHGVDLFDCVVPTREARHKVLYTNKGKIVVRKMKTSNDVIQIGCKCIACDQKISWRQLHELFSQKNPRAYFYATVHNIQFFSDLMKNMRSAIKTNTLSSLKDEMLPYY